MCDYIPHSHYTFPIHLWIERYNFLSVNLSTPFTPSPMAINNIQVLSSLSIPDGVKNKKKGK